MAYPRVRSPGAPYFLPPNEPAAGFVVPFGDSFAGGFVQPSTIPTDGPSGVYIPETAAQWEALGIPVPDSEWLMQVPSGSVPDLFGGLPLSALGGGALTYEVSIAGWNRKFINVPQVADSGLQLGSGSYNPALDDVAWLGYGQIVALAANRLLMHPGSASAAAGSGGQLIRTQGGGELVARNNGVNGVAGTYNYLDLNVHPLFEIYRRSAPSLGALEFYSDREMLTGPTDLTAINTNPKGFNGSGAAVPPQWRIGWGVCWYTAAKVQLLGKPTLQALRWPLFY